MSPPPRTHLILGASRGIGHELARQLLARGDSVLATVRSSPTPLSALSDASPDLLEIGTLDISNEESVKTFAEWIGGLVERGALGGESGRELDGVWVNAGVLEFPNRVLGRWVFSVLFLFLLFGLD
jgi:NAD(P)-dependent dehydrogenase (short-subunit alcohol dehydrogenase family)